MSVTALIAEDEPLLRAELRELLGKLWPELVICAEVEDGFQALQALQRYSPQILFLDIQMPEMSGLEVAQHASGRSHVVFITAFDRYAVEAFERGALDYLLKPLTVDRLGKAIERVKERLSSPPPNLDGITDLLRNLAPRAPQYIKWLTVPRGQELRLVTTDEICYLRAEDKYTTLCTPEAEYLLNSTLKQMREKLDPQFFWQIHRSFVVNLAAIEAVHRSFRGALEIKLKRRAELLPVSAAHAHLFRHF
ncbi:MAG TPA: LytTR family DNA-binding domain-containing protein [Steroidobacteraceae bacterium]|jgi:DNA-binding LytR/AlgR family response regulator|nr:LytTR family DNA-binding domain-containing protein [Steroidobacteraceae bacterium]